MSLSYTSVLAGASGQSSGYSISNSARFVPGNSTYLTRTPSTITSKRILSLDFWVKRATLSTAQAIISKEGAGGSIGLEIQFTAADKINITCEDGVGGNTILRTTTQVFRDVSAWYHIHVDLNSNLTTTSSCLLYVNGSQVTSFTSTTNPGSAVDLGLNTTNPFNIGRRFNASNYFGGYLAQFIYADGTQFANTVAATTNTSGVWVPKALTGITYGAAGFLMEFLNSAALGTDTSGNANTFTSSGLVAGDQFSDTPTLNYCTLNPVQQVWGARPTITSGNLAVAGSSGTVWNNVAGTMSVTSGKWIFATKQGASGVGECNALLVNETGLAALAIRPENTAYGWEGNLSSGDLDTTANSVGTSHATGNVWASGDLTLCAFDVGALKIWFGKYRVASGVTVWADSGTGLTGNPAAGTNATFTLTGTTFTPCVSTYTGRSGSVSFGADGVIPDSAIPTGFNKLNSTNLPAPAIKDGSAHFQTALHTGTGSAITVTQTGNSTFTPDFVWTKGRSGATDHILSNIISGTGKYLVSNTTAAEVTNAQALTAFGAGSISYGTLAAANTNAATYVDWMWKCGGAGVSNASGSITSTVSANTTAGISVVTYTGTGSIATVAHGLGVAPGFIVVFRRDTAGFSHRVYHSSLGATAGGELFLNSTAAATTNSANWNDTNPTSIVFTVGTSTGMNASGGTYVAICFAPIASFSAISAYTGNGSAAGPFIYTGFKPAWIMVKRTDGIGNWYQYNTAADTYNEAFKALRANGTDIEASSVSSFAMDITSNGFKLRNTSSDINGSGATFVYAAFASNPFGGSGAAPATAR